ncbi:MAG: DUF58 domain-containing protein [Chloroflexi bacterium]|nr:MAG: DUF58 domain-containing protein [Chloroflexota bacterium]TMG06524.1 MAG: DUF58 domain-containing protein [Chloroflexota bacterium]
MAVSSDGKRRRLRHLLKHDALRRVRWPILKRLGFHAWGDERSSVRGPGVEYAESREYEFGEDARTIDWNLSARSDRIYVRESHPDRGLDAWLIVDASASLDWGTALMLKREAAIDMASAASSLIARHGSRVGAIVFDANVRRILPPVAGRRGRLHLVGSLDADLSSAPTGAATALAAALWQAVKVIRRPGLLIVISDFLAAGGWQRPMAVLGHRHELVAARVVDPAEMSVPDIGVVTFEDPETGRQLHVDTSDRRLRERFQLAAIEQSLRISTDLKRAHAVQFQITTAQPFLPQLTEYLRRRSAEVSRRGGAHPA